MRMVSKKCGGQLESFMETENGMLFVFEIECESEGGEVNGGLVVIMLTKSAKDLTRRAVGNGPEIAEVYITIMYD